MKVPFMLSRLAKPAQDRKTGRKRPNQHPARKAKLAANIAAAADNLHNAKTA